MNWPILARAFWRHVDSIILSVITGILTGVAGETGFGVSFSHLTGIAGGISSPGAKGRHTRQDGDESACGENRRHSDG
ncbi:MAG: hypothetical protein R3E39_29070 [Anaerolineae bacterium]